MKQVLKRFLTLALIVALVAAIVPAASAADIELEPAEEGVIGLALTYDSGEWETRGEASYFGKVTTAQAQGCPEAGASGLTYVPMAGRLTLKNETSQPATLSFDYDVTLNSGRVTINGINILEDGEFEPLSLAAGESIDIVIVSSPSEVKTTSILLENVALTINEQVNVTFAPATNGLYTVNGIEMNQAAAENGQNVFTADYGTTFAVSASAYTGYEFLGWFTTDNSTCLSSEATTDLLVARDCTVYPFFYRQGTALFKVGNMDFSNLNDADEYASSHNHEPIILRGSATLSSGEYNISVGNILLIPCDTNYTMCTTDPKAADKYPSFNKDSSNYAITSAYCTLTLGAGVKLNVFGAISLAGEQCQTRPCLGATTGPYGCIELSTGSSITVKNGGNLYCWGYIIGDGDVRAESGATVYEPFQVMDFRGGTATTAMVGNLGGIFPISQYYVQNIESRLTLEYGARELVRTVAYVGKTSVPATVPFIDKTGENALFQMDNGCTFMKYYDWEQDRLCFVVNGDCSINTISLTLNAGKEGASFTINSGDYMLPLNGNFDVEVESGTLTVNQDMYVQPGASIKIDEDAELNIPYVEKPNPETGEMEKAGVSIVVYDSDDWATTVTSKATYCRTAAQARTAMWRSARSVIRPTVRSICVKHRHMKR